MITKTYKGFIGYGDSDKEAEDNCIVTSVFQDACNISGFEGMEKRREELAPWAPRQNSFHCKKTGYVRCMTSNTFEKYLKFGDKEIPITKSMFSTLYRAFYDTMTIVDISLCARELQEFFKQNKTHFHKFNEYSQIIPTDVYFESSEIKEVIIAGEYSIVFYNTNKVSIKRNDEEMHWTCSTFDNSKVSLIDAIYYISYVRGYSNIHNILEGGI